MGEIGLTDEVEDEVDSAGVGGGGDDLGEVLRAVVDPLGRTVGEPFEEGDLLVGADARREGLGWSVDVVCEGRGCGRGCRRGLTYPAVVKTCLAPKTRASWFAATPTPPGEQNWEGRTLISFCSLGTPQQSSKRTRWTYLLQHAQAPTVPPASSQRA